MFFFLNSVKTYEINDWEFICGFGFGLPDCEVEPLIVAIGIGIILHEKYKLIWRFFMLKCIH